jgi:hypothetical protein
MSRKLSICLVISLVAPLAGCTLLGKPKRCTERHQGSFATFLDEDWTDYCEAYRAHVERPAQFTLEELTTFFGEHPRRVEEMRQQLLRFEKYETCFQSPKEKLELRNLEGCLADDDQQDLQITNAWTVRAEPWIEDLDYGISDMQPEINDAEREAKRQQKKAAEAFDFHARMNEGSYAGFAEQVSELDEGLQQLEGFQDRYEALLDLAAGNQALTQTMRREFGPKINAIASDVQQLRERYAKLDETRRYIEFAVGSAGVPCPKANRSLRKERRIARKLLSQKNDEVSGSGVRVTRGIYDEKKGPIDYQRIEGHVCGVRSTDNQFEGAPQQCGQYRWVLERQKGSDVDDWEDWHIKSFEESGPKGGVDCALKKK